MAGKDGLRAGKERAEHCDRSSPVSDLGKVGGDKKGFSSEPISFQGKGGCSFFSRGDAAEQVNFECRFQQCVMEFFSLLHITGQLCPVFPSRPTIELCVRIGINKIT